MRAVASDASWTDVAITSAATLVAIVAGAILAKLQLDATKKARNEDLLAEFSKRWDELFAERKRLADFPEASDLAEAIRELYYLNASDYYVLSRVPNLLEDLSALVLERNIPLEMVRPFFGDAIKYHWSRWQPATKFFREDQPTVYENMEKLARLLQ